MKKMEYPFPLYKQGGTGNEYGNYRKTEKIL